MSTGGNVTSSTAEAVDLLGTERGDFVEASVLRRPPRVGVHRDGMEELCIVDDFQVRGVRLGLGSRHFRAHRLSLSRWQGAQEPSERLISSGVVGFQHSDITLTERVRSQAVDARNAHVGEGSAMSCQLGKTTRTPRQLAVVRRSAKFAGHQCE